MSLIGLDGRPMLSPEAQAKQAADALRAEVDRTAASIFGQVVQSLVRGVPGPFNFDFVGMPNDAAQAVGEALGEVFRPDTVPGQIEGFTVKGAQPTVRFRISVHPALADFLSRPPNTDGG